MYYLVSSELDEEQWMENYGVQTKNVSRQQGPQRLVQNERQSILCKRFRQVYHINLKNVSTLYSYYLIDILKYQIRRC